MHGKFIVGIQKRSPRILSVSCHQSSEIPGGNEPGTLKGVALPHQLNCKGSILPSDWFCALMMLSTMQFLSTK